MHVNAYMFFPTIDANYYDGYDMQIDSVNSVIEYVYQEMLGREDNVPDGKQHHNHFCQAAKPRLFIVSSFAIVKVKPVYTFHPQKKQYIDADNQKLASVSYDIVAPPPKA